MVRFTTITHKVIFKRLDRVAPLMTDSSPLFCMRVTGCLRHVLSNYSIYPEQRRAASLSTVATVKLKNELHIKEANSTVS